MRRILIPLALLVAMFALLLGVVASGATANDGKGKGDPTAEPKATHGLEPTKGPETPHPTEEPKATHEPEPTKGPETPHPTKEVETPHPKDHDKDGIPDEADTDDDNDGILDEVDNCQFTPNADQANADGDEHGDACDKDDDNDGAPDAEEKEYGSNPTDPDTDKDGCLDGSEMSSNEGAGGRRDPTNHWDFYDTNGDHGIDLFTDVFNVAFAFGPGTSSHYEMTLDRSGPPSLGEQPDPSKREPWDLGAPDGAIGLFDDIFGVAEQFGHSCQTP
jgi:hypothetical protein